MSNQIEEQAELRDRLSVRVKHDEEGRYGERCDGEYECVCDDDSQPYEVLSDLTLDSLLEVFNEEVAKQKENWEKEKADSLHQSIMDQKLILGTENDQAFNYARIHRWIDAELSSNKPNQNKEG